MPPLPPVPRSEEKYKEAIIILLVDYLGGSVVFEEVELSHSGLHRELVAMKDDRGRFTLTTMSKEEALEAERNRANAENFKKTNPKYT